MQQWVFKFGKVSYSGFLLMAGFLLDYLITMNKTVKKNLFLHHNFIEWSIFF